MPIMRIAGCATTFVKSVRRSAERGLTDVRCSSYEVKIAASAVRDRIALCVRVELALLISSRSTLQDSGAGI
jgi:hypothetical protein